MENKEYLKAKEFIRKYGEHAESVVQEILNNHPHKIIEKYYVDSGGNKTDDNYFELCPNELFWQGVRLQIISER